MSFRPGVMDGVPEEEWEEKIKENICPICLEGPFKRISMHFKKHDITVDEVKEIIGWNYSRALDSEEYKNDQRERWVNAYWREEASKKAYEKISELAEEGNLENRSPNNKGRERIKKAQKEVAKRDKERLERQAKKATEKNKYPDEFFVYLCLKFFEVWNENKEPRGGYAAEKSKKGRYDCWYPISNGEENRFFTNDKGEAMSWLSKQRKENPPKYICHYLTENLAIIFGIDPANIRRHLRKCEKLGYIDRIKDYSWEYGAIDKISANKGEKIEPPEVE